MPLELFYSKETRDAWNSSGTKNNLKIDTNP
jgi:hypothetical protein